ncbi:hypothetical protein KP509_17G014100 [Ceratopteris richardii]|uniref:Uncharacterized protein n=1 Tax=Ceratopteris richardii TaxID=49495 RepID=A0A8T2SW16_CERRI|nr:hypothetical protein KP509_17G014100 [Ceratopteris richardii]
MCHGTLSSKVIVPAGVQRQTEKQSGRNRTQAFCPTAFDAIRYTTPIWTFQFLVISTFLVLSKKKKKKKLKNNRQSHINRMATWRLAAVSRVEGGTLLGWRNAKTILTF